MLSGSCRSDTIVAVGHTFGQGAIFIFDVLRHSSMFRYSPWALAWAAQRLAVFQGVHITVNLFFDLRFALCDTFDTVLKHRVI